MPKVKHPGLRQRELDSLLRNKARKRTAQELIETLKERLDLKDLSKSSFDKDIAFLRNQGAPVAVNDLHQYYYTDPEFSISRFPLEEEDKKLLAFSLLVLNAYKGSSMFSKFENTIDRILAGSRLGTFYSHDQLKHIQVEENNPVRGLQWLEPVYSAIIEKTVLQIEYKRFGKEPQIRTISPYLLKEYRNRWYLVGHANETGYTNVFALDRILSLEVTDSLFHADDSFNETEYFKSSFGVFHYHNSRPQKIILEFFPPHIDYILSQPLHPSQVTSWTENNQSLIVQLEVYLSPEVEMMVLGYGSGVKVLEPEPLRNFIAAETSKIKKLYGLP